MDKETMSRIRRVEMLLEKMNVDLYPIVISDNAPAFPTSKSIWIDSGDMTLSFQYGYGNSAVWVSFGDLSIQKIIDLADVDPTDIGDGKVLVYNGITGKHEYKVMSAKLATLDDVDDANIAIGKILQVSADGITHEYVTPLTKLTATITIAVADWAGGTTCTKVVSGLLATDFVTPILDRANLELYTNADITGELQAGQIVFTATTTPTEEIVINLNIVR